MEIVSIKSEHKLCKMCMWSEIETVGSKLYKIPMTQTNWTHYMSKLKFVVKSEFYVSFYGWGDSDFGFGFDFTRLIWLKKLEIGCKENCCLLAWRKLENKTTSFSLRFIDISVGIYFKRLSAYFYELPCFYSKLKIQFSKICVLTTKTIGEHIRFAHA